LAVPSIRKRANMMNEKIAAFFKIYFLSIGDFPEY